MASTELGDATSSLRIRASPIVFSDDFNTSASTNNWQAANGTWIIENGKMSGTAVFGGDAWNFVTSVQSFTGDIVVEAQYEQTVDSNAEIVFDSTGHDPDLRNEYRVGFASNINSVFPNRFGIYRYRDSNVTALIPPDATDIVDNTIASPIPIPPKAQMSVGRLGNTITLFVNGMRIGSVTDSDPLPASGKVGLIVSGGASLFDDFHVRK